MPRQRKPAKTPKGGKLMPLPQDRRPWYHAPLRAAATALENLFGIFQRRKKPRLPRAARRRRKK